MKVPPIQFHLPRGSTPASKRRQGSRLRSDIDNSLGKLVNAATSTPLGAHVTKLSFGASSITTDAATLILFASALIDTDTWWASGAPSRITVGTKGVYQITISVDWTTTGAVEADLYLNGSLFGIDGSAKFNVTTQERQVLVVPAALSVGDYVEVKVIRPAGVAATVAAWFTAALLGTN